VLAPDAGGIRLGTNLAKVVLDQRRDSLDPEKTLAESLTGGSGETVRVGQQSRHIIGYMKDFLFRPEQAGTPLGDPSARVADVYLPAGHNGEELPLLLDLVGFTSSGLSHTNWAGFRENLPERLDRLIGEERMPPVIVAFPDCFTRLGGNQYINSASVGAWEDFLLHEMLPAIEQRYGCGGPGRRGVFSKSSGSYGAITHALRHCDI